MNDRSRKNLIKTLCAAAAVIAAVTLAVCCKSDTSRNSAGRPDSMATPAAVSSTESAAPNVQSGEDSGDFAQTEGEMTATASQTATEAEATDTAQTTTEAAAQTTPETTVQTAPEATTAETTAASTTQVPATTSPKPLWTETEYKKQLYITVDCYSRKEGVIGAEAIRLMKSGEMVSTVAITDTGYYKLDDGSFVHGDYLSETKPAATTTAATKAPSTTPKPASTAANQPTANSGSTQAPSYASEYEAEVFRLINEIRREYGLAQFKWDDAAYTVATTRAGEIMQSFGHTRPDGSSPYSLYGISSMWDVFTSVGENIAAGQKTPAEVVDSWMSSTKGHRENILNPAYENLAVAFLQGGGKYGTYWVQEFNTYR